LSGLGLAERVGKRTFQLSEDHRAALEQMQLARDLERGMTRHGELLVDPDAPQLFTELAPRVALHGRVVGGAEDEVGGRTFLVLEGTGGAVHFVLQIEEQRENGELVRGDIVTFRATHALPLQIRLAGA
jgi:hypothetical protein